MPFIAPTLLDDVLQTFTYSTVSNGGVTLGSDIHTVAIHRVRSYGGILLAPKSHAKQFFTDNGGILLGGSCSTHTETVGHTRSHGGLVIGKPTTRKVISVASGEKINNFVLQLYLPNSGTAATFTNTKGKRLNFSNVAPDFYEVKVNLPVTTIYCYY